jgi:myo-inositol-1(or 4)-monophosphatase
MSDLSVDLGLALDATFAAGEVAMGYFRGEHGRWEKGPGQIVTDADLAVDKLLKERLLGARPKDGWLSEESEDDRHRLEQERVWIVDPIDGTRSFAEGVPEFTISVALVEEATCRLGVVLNPATGELFTAVAGGGAMLSNVPIRATSKPDLQGARIVASRFESRQRGFAAMLPSVDLTTIGSLAYKLALVAAARYDAYLSWRRTHDWDIAAASLILKEAGAELTTADGSPVLLNQAAPIHEGLIAGNGKLRAAILAATHEPYGRHRAARARA